MKILTLFILSMMIISCSTPIIPQGDKFVASRAVPMVKSVVDNQTESFMVAKIKSIDCTNDLLAQANYLSGKLSKSLNREIEVGSKGAMKLVLNSALKSDEYNMDINKKSVTIEGGTPAAVFYGVQTFLQLLPAEVYGEGADLSNLFLPSVTINDYPDFSYRGMMLDVSRHFIQFDELLNYVEILSQHKVNRFHIHLTDDQGWRVEIKSHPELTSIGSVRGTDKAIPAFKHRSAPDWQADDSDPYGPFFYTQEQIKELVKFASVRGIQIIPEIDVPGHSLAINRSLHTGCDSEHSEDIHGSRGNVLCAGDEKVFEILDDVFKEIAELFPCDYIHIGGDEVNKSQWLTCPKCTKLMKDEGLKNGGAIQNYFVKRVCSIVTKHGKMPVGWNEILHGGELPKGTTIISWIGPKPGIEAAKRGIDVIMAPGQYCYFDMKDEKHPIETGHWWAGYVSLEKTYSYNPLKDIPADKQKYIKGVSGALWTEFVVPESEMVYTKTYPRLCALAEVAWANSQDRDYNDFISRMGEYHLNRLEAQKIPYRVPKAYAEIVNDSISFSKPYPEAEVYYTVDGKEPTRGSKLYTQPLSIDVQQKIKYITTSPNGRLSKYSSEGVKR